MGQGPLVAEQIDAGAKFLKLFEAYKPIVAAFWLQESEGGSLWLYVATDPLKDEAISHGYTEVGRLQDKVQDPNFDIFQVKLISSKHPLAKAAREVYRGRPWKIATRIRDQIFGGKSTDEVYIYPPPLTVPVG